MSELSRTSALASRHRALGSGLEDWNGMGTAWTYDSDPNVEHDAVREAAGMFDMSPLRKVFVRGVDSLKVMDHVLSRDMTKVDPGRAVYGSVLTDRGTVGDDAVAANNGSNEWMHCHGTGASMELLQESASGLNVDIELDDDLHDLSVQGPKSLDLLAPHASIDLSAVRYFEHQEAQLFGHPCRLSRTGYSGERGYEIFAGSAVIGDIWDQILGHGESLGVMPCSFTALDKVRIEAALLFYGYDMTDDHMPTEVGLGFTLNESGAEYRGKSEAMAARGGERFVAAGIEIDHDNALEGGEALHLDGESVGIINSPGYSHRMNASLALVHLAPRAAVPGTTLEVVGDAFTGTATVRETPFFDPDKSRTHD